MTSGQDVSEYLDILGLVKSYFFKFFWRSAGGLQPIREIRKMNPSAVSRTGKSEKRALRPFPEPAKVKTEPFGRFQNGKSEN
jgi:hypothetical protein